MTLPLPPADDLLAERPDAVASYYGPTNFTWLVRGRLAGSPCPGINQPLDTDLLALQRVGITLVVTLTEDAHPPAEKLAEFGMKSIHVPIPDMGAPTTWQAQETCRLVAEALAQGESILFHCRAGRGRTGTLLAALLIWLDPDFDAAIHRIKTTNRYWIESAEQMNFLAGFTMTCQESGVTLVSQPEGSLPLADTRSKRLFDLPGAKAGREKVGISSKNTEPVIEPEETTMSLEKALQAAMSTVPECLASGYVDMETGMLLGIQTIDSHPQEVLDTLAAATADLFQGSAVVYIENIFKQARGTKSDSHYFNEFIIFSDNLIHVFMRTKKYENHVCCFVTRKSANPGMVLTKARMSLEAVSAAL